MDRRYAVTGAEGKDDCPVPRLLVALTVHVYVLPAVRPATVIGLAVPDLVLATPPFDEVHVAE